jgi:hypothetical protein
VEPMEFQSFARWSNIPTLVEIARREFKLFEDALAAADELRAAALACRDEDEKQYRLATEVSPKEGEAHQHGAVVIVFAAFAVEGHINDYAGRRLTDRYFTDHLDRLETINKWVIIPRLVTGKRVSQGQICLSAAQTTCQP